MSRVFKFLAAAVVAGGMMAAPQAAQAQHHWHGGGWHHHGHYGGWGPGFALGFGLGAAPYYASPYYYGGGNCGWVSRRYWYHGYYRVRRVWRCW